MWSDRTQTNVRTFHQNRVHSHKPEELKEPTYKSLSSNKDLEITTNFPTSRLLPTTQGFRTYLLSLCLTAPTLVVPARLTSKLHPRQFQSHVQEKTRDCEERSNRLRKRVC
ncbi:hypothetical protein TVAGG3_0803280 [Trichomonas vaginalis G3]|uniref:hypothetical protein n=1 Tax=Trichomonas vaginalis (strain ATCC PRA-98 / G3) TaxID=412133 RepID=UPI0021E58223|nr:hypothetical protein TVAGG3_0803280 [Trichomonas vaginalis G3]KAI5496664.1 hypothetical protein TVAGG3_0803280 [Trichomonas vaginalis G3]